MIDMAGLTALAADEDDAVAALLLIAVTWLADERGCTMSAAATVIREWFEMPEDERPSLT